MKTHVPAKKNGAILVIVMAVLVAFSLMVIALLQLGKFNAFETERQLRLTRAHWIAEAGLEKTAAIIKANAQTPDSVPSELNENFDGDAAKGRYEVTIERTDGPGDEETTFTIESLGTVNDAGGGTVESTVRTVLTVAPGVHQGLVALGGNSLIKSSSSIDIGGDIYIAGGGTVGKNAKINGAVEDADDPYNVLYAAAVDVPAIDFQHLIPTNYQAHVNHAANTNNADVHQGNYSGSITFTGATNYYNGDVMITGISGSGGGAVIATGTITVNGTGAIEVPQGAKLWAGTNIYFRSNTGTSGNNELFAFRDITFDANTAIKGIGNSLLAMGGISLSANASPFAGIIYAEGKYSGSNYGVIFASGNQDDMRGTIIAWEGFNIQSNLKFTYDRSVFAGQNSVVFPDNILTAPPQWEESPF